MKIEKFTLEAETDEAIIRLNHEIENTKFENVEVDEFNLEIVKYIKE